jgi:hypothetical protein
MPTTGNARVPGLTLVPRRLLVGADRDVDFLRMLAETAALPSMPVAGRAPRCYPGVSEDDAAMASSAATSRNPDHLVQRAHADPW